MRLWNIVSPSPTLVHCLCSSLDMQPSPLSLISLYCQACYQTRNPPTLPNHFETYSPPEAVYTPLRFNFIILYLRWFLNLYNNLPLCQSLQDVSGIDELLIPMWLVVQVLRTRYIYLLLSPLCSDHQSESEQTCVTRMSVCGGGSWRIVSE